MQEETMEAYLARGGTITRVQHVYRDVDIWDDFGRHDEFMGQGLMRADRNSRGATIFDFSAFKGTRYGTSLASHYSHVRDRR